MRCARSKTIKGTSTKGHFQIIRCNILNISSSRFLDVVASLAASTFPYHQPEYNCLIWKMEYTMSYISITVYETHIKFYKILYSTLQWIKWVGLNWAETVLTQNLFCIFRAFASLFVFGTSRIVSQHCTNDTADNIPHSFRCKSCTKSGFPSKRSGLHGCVCISRWLDLDLGSGWLQDLVANISPQRLMHYNVGVPFRESYRSFKRAPELHALQIRNSSIDTKSRTWMGRKEPNFEHFLHRCTYIQYHEFSENCASTRSAPY